LPLRHETRSSNKNILSINKSLYFVILCTLHYIYVRRNWIIIHAPENSVVHSVVSVENKLEMQKLLFDYSLKNIGLPSQDAYRKILIDKVENVVRRMRWKAHFFLNGPNKNDECKFGLKSKTFPSHITEIKSLKTTSSTWSKQ
jgi:hypothetical protein